MKLKIMSETVITERYLQLMRANAEEDPTETKKYRSYWLGRRHELKYIMEQLEIPVPELKLGEHDA